MRLRLSVALGVAALGVFLAATPSAASCLGTRNPEEALRTSGVVFVGTVQSVSNRNRFAIVQVEAVLKGPALPPTVEVRGGPEAPDLNTANDRTFRPAVRYLFFPGNEQTPFQESICTATREYTPELERQLRQASSLPRTGWSASEVVLLSLGMMLVGLLLGLPLRRRRPAT